MRQVLRWAVCIGMLTVAVGGDPAGEKRVFSESADRSASPAGYHLLKTIPVPGDGGWDYVTVNKEARQVFVSHATRVEVLDADTGEVKGSIDNTKGVHGVALARDLGRGFTSNGKADSVTVFDLKTFKPLDEVKTGKNPDAIVYDKTSKHVFAFNGGSNNVTVIDAPSAKVVTTLDLGGQPEFAVSDGKGHVFVNLEDKSELLKLDAAKPAVLERWKVAPGAAPASLAIDKHNHRLFVGCRNKLLLVVNAESGKLITTLPVGDHVDATAFDPETKLIFSSNGEGTVTVVKQETPDKYVSVGTLKTQPGSKTMALDTKTHRLFIPAVTYQPVAANEPRSRPKAVPGSFVVLIFGN